MRKQNPYTHLSSKMSRISCPGLLGVKEIFIYFTRKLDVHHQQIPNQVAYLNTYRLQTLNSAGQKYYQENIRDITKKSYRYNMMLLQVSLLPSIWGFKFSSCFIRYLAKTICLSKPLSHFPRFYLLYWIQKLLSFLFTQNAAINSFF